MDLGNSSGIEFRNFYLKGFPLIVEITRCYTFTKEIDRASACCQYFNENFYCKTCLREFFATTGKLAIQPYRSFSRKLSLEVEKRIMLGSS